MPFGQCVFCFRAACKCSFRDSADTRQCTGQCNPEKGSSAQPFAAAAGPSVSARASASRSTMGGSTYFWTCVTLAGVGDIRDGFPCSASPAGPGPADNTGSASPRSATRLSRDDHPPSVGAGPLPPRQSHASSSAGGSLPAAHNSQGRGRLGGSGGSIGHPPPSQAGATTETAQAEQTQAATHNPAPAAEQEVAMPQPQAHQQQVGAATGGSAAAHRPPTGSQGGNLPPRHSQAAAATGPTRRPQQPMAGGGQMQAQRHNTAAAAAGHQHGTAQPPQRRGPASHAALHGARGILCHAAPYNPETDPWHEDEEDSYQGHSRPLPAQITAADLAFRFGYPYYDAQGNLVLPSPAVPGSSHWRGPTPVNPNQQAAHQAVGGHATAGGAMATQPPPQQQQQQPDTTSAAAQPAHTAAGERPPGRPTATAHEAHHHRSNSHGSRSDSPGGEPSACASPRPQRTRRDPSSSTTGGGGGQTMARGETNTTTHGSQQHHAPTRVPPGTRAIPGMTMREHYICGLPPARSPGPMWTASWHQGGKQTLFRGCQSGGGHHSRSNGSSGKPYW